MEALQAVASPPMAKRLALVLAVVLLAGCGASGGGADSTGPEAVATTARVPACDDVYADGTTTDPELFDQPCRQADGQEHIYGTAVADCADGRQLAHNDAGWGYVGEPWHRHADGAERVPPDAESETCEG